MINPQNIIDKILTRPNLKIDKISKKKERVRKCVKCGIEKLVIHSDPYTPWMCKDCKSKEE